MSYRAELYLSLPKQNQDNYIKGKTETEKKDLFREILYNGVHGFCFSLYEDGQKPGDIISEEQVRRRMEILKPHTSWVRSFSCTEGNEHIPKIAKEFGMKTLVGAWLGNDPEINEREVEGLIKLAKEGFVDIAAVGNEVMYRKDLSEDELLDFINHVKKEIPEIPVGYVDAYYEFTIKPRITDACDVILANCYPFWESCPAENSLNYMKQMYEQAKQAANGKPVIISETGWPSKGEELKGAFPSEKNALDYFINTQLWCMDEEIDCFYFSSFDESWKVGPEGEVGAHWGIWDKYEKLKY
ncbi:MULTISPECIES: glycosyl hydrolase family 17 protein [unclassified Chryseobacterium]|uniref:glycoside hydrolase family 17 protein n=1 Tax=unclassified Chryseobacterium TaxID=2593645 RepID=UPI000D397DA8|nr:MULTISPECIES: glycosyl hydrolase family 17 protein [unclassified Chryseobacterium]PTT75847.1 glycosyl hydrolase [Chryseobacterium sp. HMWF001]PVV55344.1 glycosyl hydrolase [Chryseobacterium sp. HMWF035]